MTDLAKEKVDPKTRWHHVLHPSVKRYNTRNSLPHCVKNSMHPTHSIFTQEFAEDSPWTSRDHRKQRYIHISSKSNSKRHAKQFLHRLGHMRRMEYWNISWWTAVAFTLGSITWVLNGFVVFLPHVNSHFQEADNSSGWTAWVGTVIFEFGSIFGMLEAWNRDDVVNFGWGSTQEKPEKRWKWFSLDTKYFRELGFLAAFFQFCGATIFWISGWTSIPNIQTAISSNTGLLDGIYWTPQVIGGVGFMISSTFMMLESQERWYKPTPCSLGWQVGLWNFIGATGFTLCGAFGYAAAVSPGADYQSGLSTFWGAWAFLIGSVVQWYEAVNSV